MNWCVLLLLIVYDCTFVASVNLCPDPSKWVSPPGLVPLGGGKAGVYTRLPNGDNNLTVCAAACCQNATCNAIFMKDGTKCALLHCASEELCQIKNASEDPKNQKSIFLLLRTEASAEDGEKVKQSVKRLEAPADQLSNSNLYGRDCAADRSICGADLQCTEDDQAQSICMCKQGSTWQTQTSSCVQLAPDNHEYNNTSDSDKPVPCEQGLRQCAVNEDCVVQVTGAPSELNRSRKGRCECVAGYMRHGTGKCALIHNSSTQQWLSTTTYMVTTAAPIQLQVHITGNNTVQLPQQMVQLTADVDQSQLPANLSLMYFWNLHDCEQENDCHMTANWAEQTVKVENLSPGNFSIDLEVDGRDNSGKLYKGQASEQLIISAVQLPNEPPVAVIQPNETYYTDDNSKVLLDGSGSYDPDSTEDLVYDWRALEGPALDNRMVHPDTSTLSFDKLPAGTYLFQLTVTDSHGAHSAAQTKVVIKEMRDDKPVARAVECGTVESGDVQVTLPQSTVYLCANMSTDDKGVISAYKWTRTDEQQVTADIKGSSNQILELSNLSPGHLEFELTVTDSKQQTDTTKIRVVVLPEHNAAPVAVLVSSMTVHLPEDSPVVLDASSSTDDHDSIKHIQWQQLSGKAAQLINRDQLKATVSDLELGEYVFRVNISDAQGQWSTANVTVNVQPSRNRPPVAQCANVTAYLPAALVDLDASGSHDDAGIVRWLWQPAPTNPALLQTLGNSSQSAVLRVWCAVAGVFEYNLTVFDAQQLSASVLVYVTVKSTALDTESVELYLAPSTQPFTHFMQRKVQSRLSSVLGSSVATSTNQLIVTVTGVEMDWSTDRIRVSLYVTGADQKETPIAAVQVVKVIRDNLHLLHDLNIQNVNTKYCKSTCSGHGECNNRTKLCSCERYWMPNLFTIYVLGHESNCAWSVLYVVLVSVLLVCSLSGLLYLCAPNSECALPWYCQQHIAANPHARTLRRRYRKGQLNRANKAKRAKAQANKNANSKANESLLVMISTDSELSSDEECVMDMQHNRTTNNSAVLHNAHTNNTLT